MKHLINLFSTVYAIKLIKFIYSWVTISNLIIFNCYFADTAAGGSDDFMAGAINTPISFTFELRDKGRFGFVVPDYMIRPSVRKQLFFVFVQKLF